MAFAKPYKISICPNGLAFDEANTEVYLAHPETWAKTAKGADLFMCYDANLVDKPWLGNKAVDAKLLVEATKKQNLKIGVEFGLFGNKTPTKSQGKLAAEILFSIIDKIYNAGGSVYSIHLDGPEYRMLKGLCATPENGLELDAYTEELLIFFKTVHEKYPEINIGLIACPHGWNYDENHYGFHPTFTEGSKLYLKDIHNAVYKKLSEGGEKIAFISVDHPYEFYTYLKTIDKKHDIDPKATYLLIQDWCKERNIDLMSTIITGPKVHGEFKTLTADQREKCDIAFEEECLTYIEKLHADGIKPQWFQIQSWYEMPCKYGPETNELTFFHTANLCIQRISELYKTEP